MKNAKQLTLAAQKKWRTMQNRGFKEVMMRHDGLVFSSPDGGSIGLLSWSGSVAWLRGSQTN